MLRRISKVQTIPIVDPGPLSNQGTHLLLQCPVDKGTPKPANVGTTVPSSLLQKIHDVIACYHRVCDDVREAITIACMTNAPL
jgi:hypothetical protein